MLNNYSGKGLITIAILKVILQYYFALPEVMEQ